MEQNKCENKSKMWHYGYNLDCGEKVFVTSEPSLCEECK